MNFLSNIFHAVLSFLDGGLIDLSGGRWSCTRSS
jgi:hypothetical protein